MILPWTKTVTVHVRNCFTFVDFEYPFTVNWPARLYSRPTDLMVIGTARQARWLVNWMCVNADYPPLVITLEQRDDYFGPLSGMQTGNVPAEEAVVRPLRSFLAACLAESLDFATAVAGGSTDPHLEQCGRKSAASRLGCQHLPVG